MAKLYFRYSTMNAGKSLQLLSVAYNYEENNEKILLFTSSKDNRYEKGKIVSRTGLEKDAIIIEDDVDIFNIVMNNEQIKAVLVDEAQFLNKEHIFQLAEIVDKLNIPVICYGLRSDFKLNPFEGSKYLMTIADSIEEIKTICSICKTKKANVNVRINKNGNIVKVGEQVKIGGNESYKPMCRRCYKNIKINDNIFDF